jgi:hypothetical protein
MQGWKVYLLPGVAALLVLLYYLLRADPTGLAGVDTSERKPLPGADAPARRAPSPDEP